jgi:hypothetical protein
MTGEYGFSSKQGDFYIHSVQNGSGTQPASYPMNIAGSFPGKNDPCSVAGNSSPPSTEMRGAIPPSPICIHVVVPNLAQGY